MLSSWSIASENPTNDGVKRKMFVAGGGRGVGADTGRLCGDVEDERCMQVLGLLYRALFSAREFKVLF